MLGINLTSSAKVVSSIIPLAKKSTFLRCYAEIQEDLISLEKNLGLFLQTETKTAASISAHIFAQGGKRVRPALYYMSCLALNFRGAFLHSMAVVPEYIHAASLLHDDVVDDSTLRRGKPAARKIWGDESSVLTGDLIYARASELMAQTGNLKIVEGFAQTVRKMSEGELIQLENIFNAQIEKALYLKIIEYKTAILLARSCEAAAFLANRDDLSTYFYEFGLNVGLAYQIIDDAIDMSQSGHLTGKKAYSDLNEGKFTLPLLILREKISANDWQDFTEVFIAEIKNISLVQNTSEKIHAKIIEHNCIEETLNHAQVYTDRALRALLDLEARGLNVNLLRECCRMLLDRTH